MPGQSLREREERREGRLREPACTVIDFRGAGSSGAINTPILGGLKFRFNNLVINPLRPAARAPSPRLVLPSSNACVWIYITDDIILVPGESQTPTPIGWTGKGRQGGRGRRVGSPSGPHSVEGEERGKQRISSLVRGRLRAECGDGEPARVAGQSSGRPPVALRKASVSVPSAFLAISLMSPLGRCLSSQVISSRERS